jgi:hypothetical protein
MVVGSVATLEGKIKATEEAEEDAIPPPAAAPGEE